MSDGTHVEVFTQAWNMLDNHEEHVHVQSEAQLGKITTVANELLAKNQDTERRKSRELGKSKSLKNLLAHKITAIDYQGPRYREPLEVSFLNELLDFFTSGDKKLPFNDAIKIVEEATKLFSAEPILLSLNIPENGRMLVCGDTHGHLLDVIKILKDNGLPSETQMFVFNGDYVDRGPNGMEVLLVLYTLKLLFPKYVYLHRGNHEQQHINEHYNFEAEVQKKYNMMIYDAVQHSFEELPIGSVVDDKILIIHGGLSPEKDVTLEEMKSLPKKKEILPNPPTREERILECLLWSDPRAIKGTRKSKRGAGVEFGPDVTKEFMERNHLQLIVRSHEVMEAGYDHFHEGTIITVFSASYYCGTNTNKGAVLVFEHGGDVLKPNAIQYHTELLASNATRILKTCVHETLEKLRERIFMNRHPLFVAFSNQDTAQTGKVHRKKWAEIMKDTLGLQIEFDFMAPYLATVDKEDNINYPKFIDRYKVVVDEKFVKKWRKHITLDICSKIRAIATDLESVFKQMDTNGDGALSYMEFTTALKQFDIGMTFEQIYDLVSEIDTNKNGTIELQEFVDKFKDHFKRANVIGDASGLDESIKEVGDALFRKYYYLREKERMLKSAFRKISDEDGHVTQKEFAEWLKEELDISKSLDHRLKLALYVDENNNGKISWKEFKHAFLPSEKKMPGEDQILQKVCEAILRSKVELRRVFRSMDTDGSGKIDIEEFSAGLLAMNLLLDSPLSDLQIKKLHNAIDKDHDGFIDYEEFITAFNVSDTANE